MIEAWQKEWKQEGAMLDMPHILVGFAALAALSLVLLAHDWRDEWRERRQQRPRGGEMHRNGLRDWWFRHRH
jgi:hypothetical protein